MLTLMLMANNDGAAGRVVVGRMADGMGGGHGEGRGDGDEQTDIG